MKQCVDCKQILPWSLFPKSKARKGGRLKVCDACRKIRSKKLVFNQSDAGYKERIEKTRTRQTIIRAHNQRELLKYYKDHPCVDCGESDPRVLHFDHENNIKHFGIAEKIGNLLWTTILKEIQKCKVRCANCHMKRTATQFHWWSAELV